ncbi:MAG: type II toxin-antitoxin system VapC family toxin [Parvularculaceae bacterium]
MIYLDTSMIVPLFLPEPRSKEAEGLIALRDVLVSDLAAAEFSSAIAMAVRTGRIQLQAAQGVLTLFDDWTTDHAGAVETQSEDFIEATALIRRFDLALRTPDALHIAIARRLDAKLLTFDSRMAAAALALDFDSAP